MGRVERRWKFPLSCAGLGGKFPSLSSRKASTAGGGGGDDWKARTPLINIYQEKSSIFIDLTHNKSQKPGATYSESKRH